MIITTAGRSSSVLVSKAKMLSISFGAPYKDRNGVSVEALKQKYQDDIVVVGKDRIFLSPLDGDAKLFFHPNLAMIRAKRIIKGEEEPFIQATKLKEGMTVLDCTLGLASDGIIASMAVGANGYVTGIEGNQLLYFLAKEGLASFSSGIKDFDEAMRRIEVISGDHYAYLLQAETDSIDVVYFDPMFHSAVDTSNGINSIRGQAVTTDITTDVIAEAKRVARRRVVLKDHWKSERFVRLGFTQHKRKTALFHYGTIELY
jgi:ubiquinone/menaquinone biosynthesis C-methylase UbiE